MAHTGRFSSPSAENKEIAKEGLDLLGLRHMHIALIPSSVVERHFLEVGNPTEVLDEHNIRTLYNLNTKLMTCPLDTSAVLKQLVPVSTLNGTKE